MPCLADAPFPIPCLADAQCAMPDAQCPISHWIDVSKLFHGRF